MHDCILEPNEEIPYEYLGNPPPTRKYLIKITCFRETNG